MLPTPLGGKKTDSAGSSSSEPALIPNVLGTGTNGIIPSNEPSPTGERHGRPAYAASSSSADTGGIIVGLSTVLSSVPSGLPLGGTDKSDNGKPTKTHDGLLSSLGITGLPTGVPTESVLPSEVVGGGRKRPNGRPDGNSSKYGGLQHLTDGLSGLPGDLTSQSGATASGVVGTLTDGVESFAGQGTNKLTGLVGTATNVVGSAGAKATNDLSGLVGTATNVVGSAGAKGSNELTNLAGTVTNAVGTAGTKLTGLVGTVTNEAGSKATGLVGTVTNEAGTKVTGLLGTVTSEVGGVGTGVVGTITSAVGTAASQATDLTGVAGTVTSTVGGAGTDLTGAVGTVTNEAGKTVTGLVETVTNEAGTVVTGVLGTVTNAAGTQVTGLVGTVTSEVGGAGTKLTGAVGTITAEVGSTGAKATQDATGGLGVTAPSGAYTITGGGATLTVPIPTSVPTSIPITLPSGVTQSAGATGATGGNTGNTANTVNTANTANTANTDSGSGSGSGSGTKATTSGTGAYSTVPAGASAASSSIQGSLTTAKSGTPTPTYASSSEVNSSTPEVGSTIASSVPLTGGTTISGTASSSYASSTEPAVVPTPPSSTTATETTKDHTKAPETIKPTGSDTYTSLTLPTSWSFAPTSTWATKTSSGGISTANGGTDTAETGLPTYMPKLVQPPGGMPDPPANATLIQLGFNYGLNYPFVVGEPDSASQIFAYLPQGIAYGLGISRHHVVMNALMPYDTSGSLNYITTLAQAYVPSSLVDTIEMSLHMPLSEMYGNPDNPVKTLMSMINPTIPILPGTSMGASSSAWYNPAATSSSSAGDGAPIGGDSGQTNHVKGSTAGVAVGAVCGAAVYAAAMVYVARRYRNKRQGHQRASSVHTSGEMSQRSGGMAGFFMSGANGRGSTAGSGGRGSRTSGHSSNGRSVREQGISNPIMAENSLGWN